MNKFQKFAITASICLSLILIISCSSPGGGTNDNDNYEPSSSSTVDSGSTVTDPSSSSSIIVPTQYYEVLIGNLLNTSYCQFPSNWLGVVTSLTNELLEINNTCIINSEYYNNLTSTQIATYLNDNNLSMYATDFDRRIADSSLDAAMLVYTNTNNYLRVLLIGYQQ